MKLSKLLKEVASDHGFSLNEIDGGQLFDFFSRKGYEVKEIGTEKDGVQKYVVADESNNQFVHFQHNRNTDELAVSQMSGYRIDQSKANRAGMRRSRDASEVGKTVYMTDGNYTPVEIDAMELRNLVTHVMTGLDREAKAQQDFYAKNPLADNINEATQFTKPSQDGDIYYSEREGKAIGIRKGDSLYHLYVFDGTPKLGKVAGSDRRWENMGPASRGLLAQFALKGVGGLYGKDAALADARTMLQFVSDMTESVNEESMMNERLNVSRDLLTDLYKDRGATAFAQMILELRDENALDDLVEALQNQYTI